jgi:MSHA biogenesis protein MshO
MQAIVNRTSFPDRCAAGRRAAGLTLIEMVISLAIAAILAIFVVTFIAQSVQGYTDLGRRAELTDAAESALRRMGRDLRVALPNSVRINANTGGNTSFAVELIPVLDGAKYTNQGAVGVKLNTGASDTVFTITGCFRNAAVRNAAGMRMVVNNGATSTDDVYSNASLGTGTSSVITAAAVNISIAPATCTVGTNDVVTFSTAHQFRGDSPALRIYVVTTPVSYLCDAAAGTLRRYAGYTIASAQPTDPSVAPLASVASVLVVDNVAACEVKTTTSDVVNRRLVTLALTLSEEGDEQVRLIYQVQLDNSR